VFHWDLVVPFARFVYRVYRVWSGSSVEGVLDEAVVIAGTVQSSTMDCLVIRTTGWMIDDFLLVSCGSFLLLGFYPTWFSRMVFIFNAPLVRS
jgi:hypothetical protein